MNDLVQHLGFYPYNLKPKETPIAVWLRTLNDLASAITSNNKNTPAFRAVTTFVTKVQKDTHDFIHQKKGCLPAKVTDEVRWLYLVQRIRLELDPHLGPFRLAGPYVQRPWFAEQGRLIISAYQNGETRDRNLAANFLHAWCKTAKGCP